MEKEKDDANASKQERAATKTHRFSVSHIKSHNGITNTHTHTPCGVQVNAKYDANESPHDAHQTETVRQTGMLYERHTTFL